MKHNFLYNLHATYCKKTRLISTFKKAMDQNFHLNNWDNILETVFSFPGQYIKHDKGLKYAGSGFIKQNKGITKA